MPDWVPLTNAEWPTEYDIPWDELEGATSEEAFVRVSFELLKEASGIFALAASVSIGGRALGGRDEGIIRGHVVRMVKLMRTTLRSIVNDDGGDQQMPLARQFFDSASTLGYLLEHGLDRSRCDAYVNDSLIAEREFLADVHREVDRRGGVALPIEERIQRSIARAFEAAAVDPNQLPSRRLNGWPSAQERLKLFGPTAYSAYRMGSGSIHGSWHDIERNHLGLHDGEYVPDFDPATVRPQPLLMMVSMGAQVVAVVVRHLVIDASREFEVRLGRLCDTALHVDELHERFLARP